MVRSCACYTGQVKTSTQNLWTSNSDGLEYETFNFGVGRSNRLWSTKFDAKPFCHKVTRYMKTYICENCGNEHDGSYGSGRFCSKHCRCSFNGKKATHRSAAHYSKRASYGTWKCERCNLIFETRA